MQFINYSGALIGPGSEWFWSMLQFVIVAATLIGLYRQLRLQSSREAIDQLEAFEREWASERMQRTKLAVLAALRDPGDQTPIPDGPALGIANFWERVGALVRDHHIDRRLLWKGNGIQSQWWWAALAPWVLQARADEGNARVYEHFEWIAATMDEMHRQARLLPFDPGSIARDVGRVMTITEDRIRLEEALRTVIKAPPGATPASGAG